MKFSDIDPKRVERMRRESARSARKIEQKVDLMLSTANDNHGCLFSEIAAQILKGSNHER